MSFNQFLWRETGDRDTIFVQGSHYLCAHLVTEFHLVHFFIAKDLLDQPYIVWLY